METRKPNKGGRPALADPAKHRHVLYLNDRENARFLSQGEQSGVTSKSRFIAARLFGEPLDVYKRQRLSTPCSLGWHGSNGRAIASANMADYIKYLYKTVRKYFGEAIVVTQEVELSLIHI